MSPSHSRHSSPALSDDDIVTVFLRIPPDDPARLVRAALVCKDWRRILTGADFCRLYREFHRTPPMLGFFVSRQFRQRIGRELTSFIRTTAFRPSSRVPSSWKAVDSRHGRFLMELVTNHGLCSNVYILWDPITNGQWGVPPHPSISMHLGSWTGAVLCAKERCDHLGCHGPPFLVAMVASRDGTTSACLYSSESGMWSDIITLNHQDLDCICWTGRSILVGNTLYFSLDDCSRLRVLKYNLGEQELCLIDVPQAECDDRLVSVSAEDGSMVFAGLRGARISLWSAKPGALAWTQRRAIKLEKQLPPRAFEPGPHQVARRYEDEPIVSGFAEGVVFLSTMAGLFNVDLNSGRAKKVSKVEMACRVTPWIGFYTQDRAMRMMPQP